MGGLKGTVGEAVAGPREGFTKSDADEVWELDLLVEEVEEGRPEEEVVVVVMGTPLALRRNLGSSLAEPTRSRN